MVRVAVPKRACPRRYERQRTRSVAATLGSAKHDKRRSPQKNIIKVAIFIVDVATDPQGNITFSDTMFLNSAAATPFFVNGNSNGEASVQLATI
jgi:hypothetical protein